MCSASDHGPVRWAEPRAASSSCEPMIVDHPAHGGESSMSVRYPRPPPLRNPVSYSAPPPS